MMVRIRWKMVCDDDEDLIVHRAFFTEYRVPYQCVLLKKELI